MRSGYFWEAVLVCLLMIVGAGAYSAWKAARPKPQQAVPPTADLRGDAAVQTALKAVRMHARFAKRLRGEVYVDETTISKRLVSAADGVALWSISGQAAADTINANDFRWTAKVAEDRGAFSVRQVRLDGDVVYTAKETSDSSAVASQSLPAAG